MTAWTAAVLTVAIPAGVAAAAVVIRRARREHQAAAMGAGLADEVELWLEARQP